MKRPRLVIDESKIVSDLLERTSSISRNTPADEIACANEYGLMMAGKLLKEDAEKYRKVLWDNYFTKLYKARPSYQFQDFEICDYHLTHLSGARRLVRGPLPSKEDLESGNYAVFAGAAQLFGRFARDCAADMLRKELGMPVLNLSQGGYGPGDFLSEEHQEYFDAAKVIVLQVLSGRSVGCHVYPGEMNTVFEGKRMNREKVFAEIWKRSKDEFVEVIGRWNNNYVDMYKEFSRRYGNKVILVWVSARKPGVFSMERMLESGRPGVFPQMVTGEMYERISSMFPASCMAQYRLKPTEFTSLYNDKPAPFMSNAGQECWQSDYYPPPEVQSLIFHEIRDAAVDLWGGKKQA